MLLAPTTPSVLPIPLVSIWGLFISVVVGITSFTLLVVLLVTWLFVGWWRTTMIDIVFLVVASKFIITILVEEIAGRVHERPILIHVEAVLVILASCWVSILIWVTSWCQLRLNWLFLVATSHRHGSSGSAR